MLYQWPPLFGYRKLKKLCFVCTTVVYACLLLPPSWGKRSNREIVLVALRQTEKVCRRKYILIQKQSQYFDCGSTARSENIKNMASLLLNTLEKEGIRVVGEIEKWIEALEQDDYAMIKKVLFKGKKQNSKLSLKEALEVRLFITIFKEQIEEQKAFDSTPLLWKWECDFKTEASQNALIDYWLPCTDNRFGRLDELHPRFDESSSDELVVRLKNKQKLLLEISQMTINNYLETGKYMQDGKNTRYILFKHYYNENTHNSDIVASDYRYESDFLTKEYTFFFVKKWMMIHLLYYPEAFDYFFKLKISDLLSLHKEEEKLFQDLAANPRQFSENRAFEEVYLEIRKIFINRLKFRLAQTCVIDDLLERHKNESIKKVLGTSTSLREREKRYMNCYLELRLYDQVMSELAKDRSSSNGGINAKLGSEHGFWNHLGFMDSFQSDVAFLESISTRWTDDFRTRVQRRYALYRLQKLIDQGKVGGIKMRIGHLGKISILDIVSTSVFGYDTIFVAEVDPKINGKNVVMIAYSDIVNIYLEEPTQGSSFGLIALGAGAVLASSKIIWSNRKNSKKEVDRSGAESEEDLTGESRAG